MVERYDGASKAHNAIEMGDATGEQESERRQRREAARKGKRRVQGRIKKRKEGRKGREKGKKIPGPRVSVEQSGWAGRQTGRMGAVLTGNQRKLEGVGLGESLSRADAQTQRELGGF